MDMMMYKTGYGVLPKSIMQDRKLKIESKAIFAYLITYAGNGDTAFPGRELICQDLGISKDRFYKYMNELKENGYIEITQVKNTEGKFAHNVYKLIPFPEIPDTVNPDTENPCTGNKDTKSNNNKNNNNNIYSTSKEKQSPKNDKQLEQIEKLWALYPNKKGKSRAIKDIKKHMKNYTYEQLENAVKTYATEVAGRDKQYIKHGSTFFKDGILDYLEAEGSEEPKASDGAAKDEEYFMKLMEEQLKGSRKLG